MSPFRPIQGLDFSEQTHTTYRIAPYKATCWCCSEPQQTHPNYPSLPCPIISILSYTTARQEIASLVNTSKMGPPFIWTIINKDLLLWSYFYLQATNSPLWNILKIERLVTEVNHSICVISSISTIRYHQCLLLILYSGQIWLLKVNPDKLRNFLLKMSPK